MTAGELKVANVIRRGGVAWLIPGNAQRARTICQVCTSNVIVTRRGRVYCACGAPR